MIALRVMAQNTSKMEITTRVNGKLTNFKARESTPSQMATSMMATSKLTQKRATEFSLGIMVRNMRANIRQTLDKVRVPVFSQQVTSMWVSGKTTKERVKGRYTSQTAQ